ncbi:MAG TPA: hypothetical protein VGO61_13980 [Steroidobacteraceae bacterium]|nr:hypothetical protein [Steroidobacteraceae bacterium]
MAVPRQLTPDVALLPADEVPIRFVTRTLFDQEDFVIVRRAGHPVGKKVTLARYRVVISEPPIPLSSSSVRAVAPQGATTDGGLSWLLGMLERAARYR